MQACMVALVAMAWSAGAVAADDVDLELGRGIELVQRGEFENAVTVLDAASRRLAARGTAPRDLARAYAYLAVAYLGLNHEQTAKAKFMEALAADRTLKLDAGEFSPRIVEMFLEAKRAMTSPSGEAGKSRSPVLIIGGVAAVGAGVALAAAGGGGGGDGPTTTAPSTTPPISGSVIVAMTVNEQTSGTVSCRAGLFFRIRVSNSMAAIVALNRLDILFTSATTGCITHQSPINGLPMLVSSLSPGSVSILVRQADLAGDLCSPPNGVPGCTWLAHATLSTSVGSYTSDIQFATTP